MGTPTVIIQSENKQLPRYMAWKELHQVNFSFNIPFCLELANNDLLVADEIIRVLPGRRLVAFGSWQGKPVVAKLFFDPQRALRHSLKDAKGIRMLQENKIPTPALLYQGESADKRVQVLIFERIFEANNLEDIWRKESNVAELFEALKMVVVELATQHVLGVAQQDLHLKNFLLTEKVVYTLDGGQVELSPTLLTKKPSVENLALFLSQLGVGREELQEKLFRHYAKSRGWLIKPDDIAQLFFQIKKWNDIRWQRYEKKIVRNCTSFMQLKEWRKSGMVDRRYLSPELMAFLNDPESVFAHAKSEVLKAGRSATVVKVQLGEHTFVVKRYNLKNFYHRARRAFRSTRAALSWKLSQKFHLFGVSAAQPVAYLEKRLMGLRGKSYYVSEYISKENAGEFFKRYRLTDEQVALMVHRIVRLIKGVAKLEVTHGDLKASNILIDANDHPVLIDFDGATEHVSIASLRLTWRKEIKRLLKNFQDQPTIMEKFKTELNKHD